MTALLPDFVLEHGKAVFLEELYHATGRTNGLYTGLWQEYCTRVGEISRTEYITAIMRDPAPND